MTFGVTSGALLGHIFSKEGIDKLLKVGFIRPIKKSTLLSPMVVVPKKNGKIRGLRRVPEIERRNCDRRVSVTFHR